MVRARSNKTWKITTFFLAMVPLTDSLLTSHSKKRGFKLHILYNAMRYVIQPVRFLAPSIWNTWFWEVVVAVIRSTLRTAAKLPMTQIFLSWNMLFHVYNVDWRRHHWIVKWKCNTRHMQKKLHITFQKHQCRSVKPFYEMEKKKACINKYEAPPILD